MVDRGRLAELLERERSDYVQRNPLSGKAFASAEHLFGRVPMTWMNKRRRRLPALPRLRPRRPGRATSTGTSYVDFCLGDTGAMAGHSPEPVVARGAARGSRELGGATAMLPTEDAEWVGAELTRRFGLPRWSFALTATDANRWAIRLVRAVTGRPKILVNSYCYHGSVDESLIVVGPDGAGAQPRGQRRRAVRRHADQPGRGVQRPGGAGARARPRRRRGRADGAGADQHRHRAARAGLPRRACAS